MIDPFMLLAIFLAAFIGGAIGSLHVLAHDRNGGMTYWDQYCKVRVRIAAWAKRCVHRSGGQAT